MHYTPILKEKKLSNPYCLYRVYVYGVLYNKFVPVELHQNTEGYYKTN